MSKPENKKDRPVSVAITVVSFLILGSGGLMAYATNDTQPAPVEVVVDAPVTDVSGNGVLGGGAGGAPIDSSFSSGGVLGK